MDLIKNDPDKSRALDILEQAFLDVAGVMWIVGRTKNRRACLRELLEYCYFESLEKKGAYLTSDRNGVVFFYKLQSKSRSIACFFRRLYLMFFVIGISRSLEIIKTTKMINDVRPKKGLYGWFLATAHDVNGIRAGYEIKRDMYRMADATGEIIYAETTTERIMMLYRRIGFCEYARMKHPYNGLSIWFMKRDPTALPEL